jgi:hypothetical protein
MYILEEIDHTETTITAKMIPMAERRYYKAGHLVIEYYDDRVAKE